MLVEYDKPIADMLPGEKVEGFYVLKSAEVKTSANGKPFLSATIADAFSSIDCKMWDYHGTVDSGCIGNICKIRGEVQEFRGSNQITFERFRMATEEDHPDMSLLVPVAPQNPEDAYARILELISSIEDEDYRKICAAIIKEKAGKFKNIPAAKSVHHAFIGGLLMHTLNMAETADFLAGIYFDTVNRSLLLAGTILHDIAKIDEFEYSSLGLVTDYSVKGELLGHLVLGAEYVAEKAKSLGSPEDKSLLLQHLILSHHGERELGAAVNPITAEAELLSMIDKIDSRMEIYREAQSALEPGQFSKRIFALDKRIYRHS